MAVFQIMYSITYHLETLNVFNQMMAGCPFHSGDAIFNFYFSPLTMYDPSLNYRGMTINTSNNCDPVLFYVCWLKGRVSIFI